MSASRRRPRCPSPDNRNQRPRTCPPCPDFLNAEIYGFGNDQDSAGNKHDAPLSWRLDKEESLSDYTIVVTRASDGSAPAKSYHVHKHMLAVGPDKSEYFSSLFRNGHDFPEVASSTSTVVLEDSAAEAFPAMLDYLYSSGGVTKVTTESAVALRHLAQYFRIRGLFVDVTEFVRADLRPETSLTYLSEAATYGDENLVSAARDLCAGNLEKEDKKRIAELSPKLIQKIFSSNNLKCESTVLSMIVAAFCETQLHSVDKEIFQTMTNEEVMPTFDPSAAVALLKTYVAAAEKGSEHDDNSSDGTNFMKRFGRAMWFSWRDVSVQPRDNAHESLSRCGRLQLMEEITEKQSEVSQTLQIQLLKASLFAAKADNDAKDADVKRLKADNDAKDAKTKILKAGIRAKDAEIKRLKALVQKTMKPEHLKRLEALGFL